MKPVLPLILLLFSVTASSQTKKIRITPTPLQAEQFHFNKITVIDTRLDTNVVGWVIKGLDDNMVPAVFDEPVRPALEKYFLKTTEHLLTNGKHELVIHVTDLFLFEDPDYIGTIGNIDIRMQAFVKVGDTYYSIHKIDKQELLDAMDVTQKMFKTLNTLLADFIKTANEKFTGDLTHKTPYTWDMVMQLRQKELMEKYPLFKLETPKDGIYAVEESFLNQEPDLPIEALDSLIQTNLGKPMRKRVGVFGYCKDGKIYFYKSVKAYQAFEVYRRGNSFFMQDYGLDPELQAAASTAGWVSFIAFGYMAGVSADMVSTAANNGNRAWYEFVFNPRNSMFYHYKKLAATKEEYLAKTTATSME